MLLSNHYKNHLNYFLFFLFFAELTTASNNDDCVTGLKTGDYHTALKICNSALEHAETTRDSEQQLQLFLNLSRVHHKLGNSAQEAQYLDKIRTHADFLNYKPVLYEWNRKMGQKLYGKSAFKAAEKYLYTALEIAQEQNNPIWLSKSYNDVGLVEAKQENYKKSLEHYQQSLALKKQYGNDHQIGITLNNIGLVHLQLEQPALAVNFYEEALTKYLAYANQEKFDERVYYEIAHIYEDLTKAHAANNDKNKADYYAQAILDSFGLKISKKEQTRALINLVKWHIKQQNFFLADTFLTATENNIRTLNHPEYSMQILFLRAQLDQHNGNTSAAIAKAQQSLALAVEIEKEQIIAEIYQWFSQLYHKDNSTEAFKALQSYQQYREDFLKKKYDFDLKTIQHQIEKQQIEQSLLAEQLTNSIQKNRLQKLTNYILFILFIFFTTMFSWYVYHQRKKREKEDLLNSIHYHQQQLLLMETEQANNISQTDHNSEKKQLKCALKKLLVETMIDAVHIWEVSTQSSQIELAEQSQIWTISIDNGNLRTRSLDKYLSLDKIPNNPRWRNVIKTGHFILSKNEVSPKHREELKQRLDQVMEIIKSISTAEN